MDKTFMCRKTLFQLSQTELVSTSYFGSEMNYMQKHQMKYGRDSQLVSDIMRCFSITESRLVK